MPKVALTPEQKALNKAIKKQAEEDARIKYEFEKQAALAKYKADLPSRLMAAQALASSLGVSSDVSLTEIGPAVSFNYENENNKIYLEDSYSYISEEWEVERLESKLNEIKSIQDENVRRMQVAQSAYSKLSDDEKTCLTEYIRYCR